MSRAALVFPGRGSYTSGSLGSLPTNHPLVGQAEALRATYADRGLPSLASLDGATAFDPRTHLRPANASPLIYVASLVDATVADADHRVVVTLGNSLGWYTALAASGVLSFSDGFRLVQEMALLQEQPLPAGGPGGQVIYPLSDADWRPDAERRAAVAAVVASGEGELFPSIHLGGYAVLAGTEAGVERLLRELPPVTIGDRLYPLRLALHGPYHTPLLGHVAVAAAETLADLRWSRPRIPLVDGRGVAWSPWSSDPSALRDYTLTLQPVVPYDFATSLRVALREWAPEVLVLPGPGNSLGGICGQILVGEGYGGIRDRAAFAAAQRGPEPVLLSMGR
jgi:[acyl-carrier-protein] S-malonyltransferase